MKLYIEDAGRDGKTEIAVEKTFDGAIKFLPYVPEDLTNAGRLNADFWKRNGYVGRLEITDGTLDGVKYVTNVK